MTKAKGAKARFSDTYDLNRELIALDPARFQGRQGAHSEDTVRAIIAKGHYDRSGEPIVVWQDPDTGTHYVISGHSRWEATEQLYGSGKQPDLKTVPVKRFLGDLDEAIDYAVLESNRGSSEEGLLSDLNAYRRAVERGMNRAQLLGIFKPETRLRKLQDLSALNPRGQFIEMLAGTQAASFPYLERNARWTGILRNSLPALTNAHEQEIFNYLYKDSQKGLKLSKDQFYKLIGDRVNRIDFDPELALNLHDRVSASAYTDPINEAIADINRRMEVSQREIEAKRALIARARTEGKEGFIPKFQERISELNRDIIKLIQEREDLRQKAGRIERTMTADLFSEPVPEEAKPDKLKIAKEKAAAQAQRLRLMNLNIH